MEMQIVEDRRRNQTGRGREAWEAERRRREQWDWSDRDIVGE